MTVVLFFYSFVHLLCNSVRMSCWIKRLLAFPRKSDLTHRQCDYTIKCSLYRCYRIISRPLSKALRLSEQWPGMFCRWQLTSEPMDIDSDRYLIACLWPTWSTFNDEGTRARWVEILFYITSVSDLDWRRHRDLVDKQTDAYWRVLCFNDVTQRNNTGVTRCVYR